MLSDEPSSANRHSIGATSDPQLIVPTTTTKILDKTVSLVDTVLKLAQDVVEVLENVPYVKSLAGIIVKIIAIRDEINTAKERSRELIEKVLDRSKVILEGLLFVAKSPHKETLTRVEGKLTDYFMYVLIGLLLTNVLDVLKRNAGKSLLNRVVNRKAWKSDLKMYDRRIDNFNTDFLPVLPPPPEIMIGRDIERTQVINTLLDDDSPPHIAILGAGGMGKTTLALSVLHDRAVASRYPSRFFVSCEGTLSVSSLVVEIANALRIPFANRDEYLLDTVLSSFPEHALLCLDNLETIWGNESMRLELEGLLSALQTRVGILITMRGTQRPSRVTWSKPYFPPLHSLSDSSSKDIFEISCGPVDNFVEKLLKAVDGIPLAISLIGALLKEGHETSKSLWGRWTKAQSGVLEMGGDDRLSSLETSIFLSVYGPQMQADPRTIDILAMLSMLPDGVSSDADVLDQFASSLPEGYKFHKTLLTLQRVSLVHLTVVGASSRLRMLHPVRAFCKERLEFPVELRDSITSFFVAQMNHFNDVTNSAAHAVIPAELQNTHAVLKQALEDGKGGSSLVARACIMFTYWTLYLGSPSHEVINLAIDHLVDHPEILGNCHRAAGKVHLHQANLDKAAASFRCAAALHKQVQHVLEEGNDLSCLGEVQFRQDNLTEAEATFKRALELHRRAQSVRGEANDVTSLGKLHLQQDRLAEAEISFTTAIVLYRQSKSVIGEANNVGKLGMAQLQQNKLNEAEASFRSALVLHRQAKSVLGEANDVLYLGVVHLEHNQLAEAELSFKGALALHRQAQDVLGEANDVRMLGEVQLQQDKLDEAETSFESAARLYTQAKCVWGEAISISNLGEVHLQRGKLDDAKASFERSMKLHQGIHDELGQAHNLGKLKEMELRFPRHTGNLRFSGHPRSK
ncbi:hypothetical protein H0H93_006343 [Arthromyces matolae]|nr:hypothetical protein H0H93_006343 [Arthromyces matolae]